MRSRSVVRSLLGVVSVAAVAVMLSAFRLAEVENAGPGNCFTCLSNCVFSNEHKTGSGADVQNYAHSECVATSSECPHPQCTNFAMAEEVDAMTELVIRSADGDRDAMRTLLSQHSELATFNVKRQSLQVTGCNDELIANVPLTPEDVAVLERVLPAGIELATR